MGDRGEVHSTWVITPLTDGGFTITTTDGQYLYASGWTDADYASGACRDGIRRWVHTSGVPHHGTVWDIRFVEAPSFHVLVNQAYGEYLYMTAHAGPRGPELHTWQGQADVDKQARFAIRPASSRLRLVLPDGRLLSELPETLPVSEAFSLTPEGNAM